MNKKNIISIYACGGAGINIATKVLSIPPTATGFPDVEYTLIDTSESNIDKDLVKDKNVFLIPGLDGSGKDRKFGYENVEPQIIPILRDNKPKDFSIVIFSLSGGSGSVIGPLLIKELLSRDLNVFAICIGNLANGKEADNSLKTIATLQGISSKIRRPIVSKFYLNDNVNTRIIVDKQIENDIRALALLLSGANNELDDEDIHNLLYYPNVTQLPPQLVDMVIYSKSDSSEDPSGFIAIGIASLLTDKSDQLLIMGQPYGCVGYMPNGVIEATSNGMKPLHFILTNALMNERMEKFKTIVKEFESAKEQLVKTASLKLEGNVNDDGFVF